MSDLVEMASADGREIRSCGVAGQAPCTDEDGRAVDLAEVRGVRLAGGLPQSAHIYFIGIGMTNADLQVGRILAEATGSKFIGTNNVSDLETIIVVFKGFF